MPEQQRIVHFGGEVQGVGFRYTACRVASGFDVSGYIRNLPDGRVECVVEGRAKEIDAFLETLSEQMSGYIQSRQEQTVPATGRFSGFGVRR